MIVDGDAAWNQALGAGLLASMGPSMIVDGDTLDGGFAELCTPASMGPSMIVDGDSMNSHGRGRDGLQLQWGRR